MTVEQLIARIAASSQHKHLYHFTDESNFPSVDKHGLLSKEQLRAKGLWPPKAAGGNELNHASDSR